MGMPDPTDDESVDPVVERLAGFFREHEVWQSAAELLHEASSSRVSFSHLPDEQWRLVRRDGVTVLESGYDSDPDLEFRFTPGAVMRITEVDGGVAEFAIALFSAALDSDPERRLGLTVVAPFSRLLQRGYLRLLWAGGGPVLAFGARHGIRSIGELRDLVARLSRPT